MPNGIDLSQEDLARIAEDVKNLGLVDMPTTGVETDAVVVPEEPVVNVEQTGGTKEVPVSAEDINLQNITAPQLPTGTTISPTGQVIQEGEVLVGDQLTAAPTVQAQPALTPEEVQAAQIEAATIGGEVDQAAVDAATGVVSEESLVQAAQTGNIPQAEAQEIAARAAAEAAEITGDFAIDPVTGELSPDAVITAAQAQASAEFNAAISSLQQEINQTPVDPRATVREQYSQLMDFDVGETPAWAAGAMRAANQMVSLRGIPGTIGAEAVTSALMQAALPIAQQDAQIFATWSLSVLEKKTQVGILRASHLASLDVQNLGNRQQAAVVNAQSALQIQMFNLDAEQQAKVLNAQNALSIASQNAGFKQQAALENARNFLQMDVSNLDARTRTAIQNAQAALTLEAQNLNNRQQAAVENARAFLNMDFTNLSNEQQAAIVNSQNRLQTMLSDNAAINAAIQFNATSQNQVNTFMASLAADISKFNSAQTLTADQFSAAMSDAREQFDNRNALLIEQANVQYLRQINTINTADINRFNLINAQNLLGISNTAMANALTLLRDENVRLFQASESELERALRLGIAELDASTKLALLDDQQKFQSGSQIGAFITGIISNLIGK